MSKVYNGINIQFPISQLIISGRKSVETRTYPIPKRLIGKDLVLIETPGKKGKFKARMIALIRFEDSFPYKTKTDFYKDLTRHCVDRDSPWAWNEEKPKWGWPVEVREIFRTPLPLQKRSGIRYATGIRLP